jgi:hypothetical protein
VAVMMLKHDSNLANIREILTPYTVTEDEFWRNYFYAIEFAKKSLGMPTRLGQPLNHTERDQLIKLQE